MCAIFSRPQSDLELVESGVVPRGWLYSIGGGIYLQSRDVEKFLQPDGLPGPGLSTGDRPQTLSSACAVLGLTRTLFGGVKLKFVSDLRVGEKLRAEDSNESVRMTQSAASGAMAITTVMRRIFSGDRLVLEQRQTDVIRGPPRATTESGSTISGDKQKQTKKKPLAPSDTTWRSSFRPYEVSLFSYSALTFNRHRIHYDAHWAEDVEGYPGIMVHGPFVMQLCIDFIRDRHPGKTLAELEMRAMQPLFVNQEIVIVGKPVDKGSGCLVWALCPDGTVAQEVRAIFEEERPLDRARL